MSNSTPAAQQVVDRTVNPLPEHLRALAEPYIQWREDMAVARFVLEQAERDARPVKP